MNLTLTQEWKNIINDLILDYWEPRNLACVIECDTNQYYPYMYI